jgi:hypothetical protein
MSDSAEIPPAASRVRRRRRDLLRAEVTHAVRLLMTDGNYTTAELSAAIGVPSQHIPARLRCELSWSADDLLLLRRHFGERFDVNALLDGFALELTYRPAAPADAAVSVPAARAATESEGGDGR